MLIPLHETDLLHIQGGCYTQRCWAVPWREMLKCFLSHFKTDNVWAG